MAIASPTPTPVVAAPKTAVVTSVAPAVSPVAGLTSNPTAATSDPPFRITTPGTRGSRWFKGLIYGIQGGGKTTLVASAVDVPEMQDVIMIDAERGDSVLDDNPRIKAPELISTVQVTNFVQIAKVQEYLKAHCIHRDSNNIDRLRAVESVLTGVPVAEITTPKRFRTVILDTLSEMETYNFYGLMGMSQDALVTGAADDIEVATWDTFRKNNMMMQMLVRAFRDLPMHVLFTCHQAYTQDEIKRHHYNLSLTGKLANQVAGLVDLVGFLQAATQPDEKGNQPRRLSVQPTGRFAAKNRRAGFREPHLDDPTMTTIMQKIGLIK